MRECTKEEFDKFIAEYPHELHSSTAFFCEPPVKVYHDASRPSGLNSIVARVHLFESYPKDGDPPYRWAPNEYAIRKA